MSYAYLHPVEVIISPHVPHCDDAVGNRHLLSAQLALPLVHKEGHCFRTVYSRDFPEGGTEGLIEYGDRVVLQEAGAAA